MSIDPNQPGSLPAKVSPELIEGARMISSAPSLLAALERLEFAARCRDNTMGDPCRLIEVKAELDAAAKQAREAIAMARREIER